MNVGRLLTLLLVTAGCARPGPLQEYYAELKADFDKANIDEWAKECAPRELALAETNREFAELEFKQGDIRRAEQHLLVARENIKIAVQKADACRPKDRDGDGIMDDVDQCPDEPEDMNGVQDQDGCPEHDRDRDGISDDIDQCPDEPEDMDNFKDSDGCPDIDNDSDGLVDTVDKCPNDPEDMNGYQDEDGCPEGNIDRDGDGIRDDIDRCPDEPENKNDYLDEDGCPDVKPQNVKITKDQIVISEKIQFETAKARILPQSFGILDAVAQVMRDYPKIRVRVEGHTDSQGSDAYNLKLSDDRADSVRRYLTEHGIEASRLESVGHGETKPLDTNKTNAGRAMNRRVEFHIIEGM